MHGLRCSAADGAFFTRYFIIYTVSAAINTLFLYLPTKYGAILNYTSASVIFVLLVLYSTVMIIFTFFVSAFFDKGMFISGFRTPQTISRTWRSSQLSNRRCLIIINKYICDLLGRAWDYLHMVMVMFCGRSEV